MGALYPGTSVNGYNANPPPDDGTTIATNLVTWAGIKSKIGDPLNTFAAGVDSNLTAAFGKTLDGASIVSTAVDYPMTAADQGRLIAVTVAGKTVTTPDATVVGAPFTFSVSNQSTGTITIDGNGTQTVDGQLTQAIAPGGGCIVKTDGANWFTYGLNAAQFQSAIEPQGYLTLNSNAADIFVVSDTLSATAVYYSPLKGNLVPIYNGSVFQNYTFAQLTLTLAVQHLANTIYDVFVFLNAGVVTIATGPAWSNSGAGTGARGTGAGTTQLSRVAGLRVNTVALTARNGANTYTVPVNQGTYLGSIFTDGVAGQASCHVAWGQSRKWAIWNAFNRSSIILQAGDSTASWSYATATWRQSNAAAGNTIAVFSGLPEEWIDLSFEHSKVTVAGSSSGGIPQNAIGVNSTTTPSGTTGFLQDTPAATAVTVGANILARYFAPPAIGINNINSLEIGNAGGAPVTWFGTQANMLLLARWNG